MRVSCLFCFLYLDSKLNILGPVTISTWPVGKYNDRFTAYLIGWTVAMLHNKAVRNKLQNACWNSTSWVKSCLQHTTISCSCSLACKRVCQSIALPLVRPPVCDCLTLISPGVIGVNESSLTMWDYLEPEGMSGSE